MPELLVKYFGFSESTDEVLNFVPIVHWVVWFLLVLLGTSLGFTRSMCSFFEVLPTAD